MAEHTAARFRTLKLRLKPKTPSEDSISIRPPQKVHIYTYSSIIFTPSVHSIWSPSK